VNGVIYVTFRDAVCLARVTGVNGVIYVTFRDAVCLACVTGVNDVIYVTCRDAVCLARVRLSSSDPVLHRLFTSWAAHLSRDGNYELAAKWLVITCITDSQYHMEVASHFYCYSFTP